MKVKTIQFGFFSHLPYNERSSMCEIRRHYCAAAAPLEPRGRCGCFLWLFEKKSVCPWLYRHRGSKVKFPLKKKNNWYCSMMDSIWHLIWLRNLPTVVWRILYSWLPLIIHAERVPFRANLGSTLVILNEKAIKILNNIFHLSSYFRPVQSVTSTTTASAPEGSDLQMSSVFNTVNSLFSVYHFLRRHAPSMLGVHSLTTLSSARTEIFVFAPVWPWGHLPLFVLQVRFHRVVLFVWLCGDLTVCLQRKSSTSLHKNF